MKRWVCPNISCIRLGLADSPPDCKQCGSSLIERDSDKYETLLKHKPLSKLPADATTIWLEGKPEQQTQVLDILTDSNQVHHVTVTPCTLNEMSIREMPITLYAVVLKTQEQLAEERLKAAQEIGMDQENDNK